MPDVHGRQEVTEASRWCMWAYPNSKLRESTCQGLAQTIAHYVGVGGHHVANYFVDKAVLCCCQGTIYKVLIE